MKSQYAESVPEQSVEASVIVTVYNIAGSVQEVYESLKQMTGRVKASWELVFVDDGSTDDTFKVLKTLADADPRMRVVKMRSNFGEAAALEAGLKYSKGKRIVYMSGRVRVNPSDIPRFLEKLDSGYDLVVGWRSPRRDSWLNRRISSVFNRMASLISRVKLHDINSGVFVTYRSVLEKVEFYGNLYNFIPVLAGQQGYRVAEETIEQLKGTFRTSRYPREYIQRLLDIITVFFLSRYSKKPIHFLGFVGTIFVIAGLGIEIYLFIYRILGMGPIAGRPLLVLGALLLVIGIQVITIGLLGEMIIFTHAGDIEEYNIEEVVNDAKGEKL
jgi:glycosyltransferase involved in cell wall biosynthesis